MSYNKFINTRWDIILRDHEAIRYLFEELGIGSPDWSEISSKVPREDDRLIMRIVATVDDRGAIIIIDATPGIPTLGQYLNVTYEQGADADIRVILYGQDELIATAKLATNSLCDIRALVRRNNWLGIKTILAKGIEYQKYIDSYEFGELEIKESPYNDKLMNKIDHPTEKQSQEIEFWNNYYNT